MILNNTNQLKSLYPSPKERALKKVLSELEEHCSNFILKSPFCVLSTVDAKGGMDISPKGGLPGFVKIRDSKTLLLPDSKGNNRLDGIKNIIETGRIAIIFFIPGINETLRVHGSAQISSEENDLNEFKELSIPPATVMIIKIEEVFLHCAKALMRSKLWEEDFKEARPGFPTMGQMLKDQIGDSKEPESQEEMEKRYQKDL